MDVEDFLEAEEGGGEVEGVVVQEGEEAGEAVGPGEFVGGRGGGGVAGFEM